MTALLKSYVKQGDDETDQVGCRDSRDRKQGVLRERGRGELNDRLSVERAHPVSRQRDQSIEQRQYRDDDGYVSQQRRHRVGERRPRGTKRSNAGIHQLDSGPPSLAISGSWSSSRSLPESYVKMSPYRSEE